jgi:hypothetical protein
VAELLNGVIEYPVRGYDGYGDMVADQATGSLTENWISDEMRQDWEANREALMALWRSGKSPVLDLSEFGLNVRWLPWLCVCGSRNTLPWAAKEFDGDRLARHPRRARAGAGGQAGRLRPFAAG